MSTLFLIRHGLTAQTGKTLYGQIDGIPLDERGQAQAQALAERFAPVRLTAIYSSPLERCVQSVEPLALAQRLEVVERAGLIEMDAGSWTGKPLSRLRHTNLWKEVQASPSTFRFPDGGESFAEAQARVVADLRAIAGRHRRGRVAVATHGDIVRILLSSITGAPLDTFQRTVIDTASVSVVTIDKGSARIHLVNDTGGLERFAPGTSPGPWEAAAHRPRRTGNLRG
jgi:probable phosphomutase (TIGR03848 family)